MKRIFSNYIYNLIYQLTTFIIPIVIIPIVIERLGPKNLGIDAYTLSIVGFFVVFANFGINTYATRRIAVIRDNNILLKKETYSILLLKFIFTFLSFIGLVIFSLNNEYKIFFLFQFIYFFGSTIFDVNWYYAGLEKFKLIVLRNLFIKFTGAILIIFLIDDDHDLWKYILINGFVIILPNVYFFIILILQLGKPVIKLSNMKDYKNDFKNLITFFILSLSSYYYINIDKVVMEKYSEILELGIYTQIFKLIFAIIAPLTALGTILMPFFSNNNGTSNEYRQLQLYRSANFITIISFGMFFGYQSLVEDIIKLFFGKEYLLYIDVFRVSGFLIIIAGLYNFLIQQLLLPNNKEKKYLLSMSLIAIAKTGVLLFVVPRYGLVTIMGVYIISEVVLLLICGYVVRRYIIYKVIFKNIDFLKITLSSAVMFIFITFINLSLLLKIIIGIIVFFTTLVILKEKLITFFTKKFIDFIKSRT